MNQFDLYRGDGEPRPALAEQVPTEIPLHAERGRYLAEPELAEAVNIALQVGQPLLVTGEPGCGKTRLAGSVAVELGLPPPLCFYTRSSSRAQDLLYSYDAVGRFQAIQSGDPRAQDPARFIRYEALGEAIRSGARRMVLIDEIDKAPRDFPNDLLHELDRMAFEVRELEGPGRFYAAALRPIVVITSNSERQLPLPFLRRCVFFHIPFPSREKLVRILHERLGGLSLDGELVQAAVDRFRQVREVRGLAKKPATGELLTWMLALHRRAVSAAALRAAALGALPLWPALLKDREDQRRLLEAT